MTPLKVCNVFPAALMFCLFSSIALFPSLVPFLFLWVSLRLWVFLCLNSLPTFLSFSLSSSTDILKINAFHIFGESGTARGGRQTSRALSIISYSFHTTNTIKSFLYSHNHSHHSKPNIILSIIGYLRRKSLEVLAWKTPPLKGFFPLIVWLTWSTTWAQTCCLVSAPMNADV